MASARGGARAASVSRRRYGVKCSRALSRARAGCARRAARAARAAAAGPTGRALVTGPLGEDNKLPAARAGAGLGAPRARAGIHGAGR